MFKKTAKIGSALVLTASLLSPSAFAASSSEEASKLTMSQTTYNKKLQEYNSKEEVKFAKQLQKLSQKEIKKHHTLFQKKIEKFNDDEYNRFIYNYVKDNHLTVGEMTNSLAEVGIEFNKKPKPLYTIDGLSPSDMTLDVYSSKRWDQSYYHLTSSWSSYSESSSATIDLVSVEWDPDDGYYYSSSVGDSSIVTKRDGSQRSNGIYLFNVEDDNYDFDSYATVQVVPSRSGWLDYGSKYTHTYTTYSTSSTGQAYFSFDSTGPSGGFSYTVSQTSKVSDWSRYDDNAVYID
ncbi:hypothetical protein JI667_14585 [Bacillus sp. NTK074B]|uniref:hypothetical protein n=1 Tax=Bacillus sp. NTK074B TaxID=2802174 RepID=UPI001A901833|nr:hypothetical protein [Bacillus sp. NTK074B]